jgi:hypothetical protein
MRARDDSNSLSRRVFGAVIFKICLLVFPMTYLFLSTRGLQAHVRL